MSSFAVYGGEILGIAGISGSGQKELLEAIAGLQPVESGAASSTYMPERRTRVQLVGKTPMADPQGAASACPSSRRTAWAWAWSASMGMTDNMMLRKLRQRAQCPIARPQSPAALARRS